MRNGLMVLLAVSATPVAAQTLATKIATSHAPRVTFIYAGRPGLCGDGDNMSFGNVHQNYDNDRFCTPGPARVTIDLDGATILRIKTTVGGPVPSGATDLGEVAPAEAADWLLAFAAKGQGKASEEAVMPAAVARDVVVWPRLAAMAKDQDLREGTRRSAVFWLGQEAADEAVGPLEDLVDDDPDHAVREAALFALSQQHNPHATDILIRTARSSHDRKLRRTAFFWLGQSEDPRGIQLFEEVLAGR